MWFEPGNLYGEKITLSCKVNAPAVAIIETMQGDNLQ